MAKQTKELTIPVKELGRLAALGISASKIAAVMDMSPDTFQERIYTNPYLLSEWRKGEAQVEIASASALMDMVKDHAHPRAFNAAVFFLRCKCGWQEKPAFTLHDVDSWQKVHIAREALHKAEEQLLLKDELKLDVKQIEDKTNAASKG